MWSSFLLVVCGLLLMAWGFWGGSRWRSPYGAFVAWGTPVGLLIALIGIVTLVIPDFFR